MTRDEVAPRHLFVYGTLRPGGGAPARLRRLLREHARVVGSGTVPGRLHDAGPYPAAVALPKRASERPEHAEVHGTVFILDDPSHVLKALDGYEGVQPGGGGLFRRDVVEVRLEDGRVVEAWIYWYDRDVEGLPAIHGGDWSSR